MNAKPDAPSGSSSHRARSATTARQSRSRRSPPSNLSVLITPASQEQRPAAAINTSDLNPTLFPRRDDGRVVLTPPWFTTSTDPPTIPQHTQDLNLGRRNELVSRVSSHEPLRETPIEGARSQHLQIQTDRGERPSRSAARRLSGPGISPAGDSQINLVPSSHGFDAMLPVLSTSQSDSRQASRTEDRRLSRRTRPYNAQTEPQDARPHPMGSNQPEPSGRSETSIGLPNFVSRPTLDPSITRRREAWPDPYENMASEPFPQLFELPSQIGPRLPNLSSSNTIRPLTHPKNPGEGYKHDVPSRGTQAIMPLPSSSSSRPPLQMPPSRRVTPSHSQPSTPIEVSYEQPHVIRFNSYSRNPLPSTSTTTPRQPTTMLGDLGNAPQVPPPLGPGPSTSVLTLEVLEETQSQIRFHDPVITGDQVPTPVHPQEAHPIVQVKWDSDRKRRQGYFAQDEGSEKSNFRHYNKSQLDFDN